MCAIFEEIGRLRVYVGVRVVDAAAASTDCMCTDLNQFERPHLPKTFLLSAQRLQSCLDEHVYKCELLISVFQSMLIPARL